MLLHHISEQWCHAANGQLHGFVPMTGMDKPLSSQPCWHICAVGPQARQSQCPCSVTFHPAALAWQGLEAAQHLVSAFQHAACIASGGSNSQSLAPAFTKDSMPQLLKRLAGPLPRLLVGEFGLATVYNGRYLGLSAAFINSKLACLPCLPHSTQVMVGKVVCPKLVPITMSRTLSKSNQIQLRVLGLQHLLLLLHLSSTQAVVKLLADDTLLVCFSPSLGHPCTSEELQQKHEEAAQKALVRMIAQAVLLLIVAHCAEKDNKDMHAVSPANQTSLFVDSMALSGFLCQID